MLWKNTEYAGVMCHSRINRSRNGTVNLICIQKPVKNLTCGTDVAPYMIDIRKPLIAYMMVNACGLFAVSKYFPATARRSSALTSQVIKDHTLSLLLLLS